MKYLILIPILLPILAGCLMFPCRIASRRVKLSLIAAALAAAAAAAVANLFTGGGAFTLLEISDTVKFALKADWLTLLFSSVTSVLWLVTGVYSFGYMRHEENENRFYAFMLITLGILNALFFSANLLTMYLFFELATLASVPLVLHSLTKESISAALKYLFYSIGGAFLGLFGIIVLYSRLGDCVFLAGGYGAQLSGDGLALAGVFLMIVGFGTKAGMYPMHGWLPAAHPVAPSPASALLSGLIAKAGVFAVIRTVFYVVGPEMIRDTWVQYAWIALALITVFMGSMMAYREKLLKKRLAFSTVSQISYIMLGLSLLNETAFFGALLHFVYHAVIKSALFMSAGSIIYSTGKTRVDELEGIGKNMPATMWAYTLASVALIGIPPACGFVSKWFLCEGALESSLGFVRYLAPAILLISALLTAGYLLPLTVKGFFPGRDFTVHKCETDAVMYIPLLLLGILSLALGIFTAFPSEIALTVAENIFG